VKTVGRGNLPTSFHLHPIVGADAEEATLKVWLAGYITSSWWAANVQDDPSTDPVEKTFARPSPLGISFTKSDEWLQKMADAVYEELKSVYEDRINAGEVIGMTAGIEDMPDDEGYTFMIGNVHDDKITGEEVAWMVVTESEVHGQPLDQFSREERDDFTSVFSLDREHWQGMADDESLDGSDGGMSNTEIAEMLQRADRVYEAI
jgi:hypothetical protein